MHRRLGFLLVTILCLGLNLGLPVMAQTGTLRPLSVQPRDRVTQFVDDEQRVVLRGNLHPMARPEYESGVVAPDYRMKSMVMVLRPDVEQQKALDQLVAAQHDPKSPSYHQWLTPESYAEHFGISESDLAQIVSWLQMHGMSVDEVTPGRRRIIFSGTVGQVESAFHTQIHTYKVGGELHHANAREPEIPLALIGVVGGLVSLHDFRSQPLHSQFSKPSPQFTSGSGHYLSPADFATIYDVAPLYQQTLTGSGQSVAIVGRTNINLADVRLFRSSYGLPANDPQIIVNGADPGIVSTNEEVEADLDVEWSGAVAKNAAIKFVVSASTNSSDGTYLSAQYIVNHNLAPVMSMSFGLCEAPLGSSGNAFINSLWQQAAAQGITVFVSSGDSGAAGCDSSSAASASAGRGVNGLCSTPYSVCVGGTQFNDTANPSLYWSSSNASGTQASALSYIPENVWNESGHSGLWASGGGASTFYSKPSWQAGTGVPADGKRDVPDVSLTAAGHDGYLVYMNGSLIVVSGTSAASPALAGLMALVVQGAGARQGNANPAFYSLADKQRSFGGAAVYHDITSGNNSVPGVTGYTAAAGYDLATGLGSVDAYVLVNHWTDGSTVPTFQLSPAANAVSLTAGGSANLNSTVTVSGGFNSAVSLSVSGLPTGVTATFTPASFAAPGSGTSVLKFTATTSAKAGSYPITLSAASSVTKNTAAVTLTVLPAPTYSLTASPSSMSLAAGKSATVNLTTVPANSFNAAVALTVTGLPTGMTASLTPTSFAAPGSGTSKLTLSAASSVAPGTYSLVVTANGGGVKQTAPLTVNVPGFTLSGSITSASVSANGKVSVTLTTHALGGFNSEVALSVSGLPSGISASFSPQSVAAPGNGSSTLTLTRASGVPVGTSTLTVSGTGGGITKTVTLNLTSK